MMYSLASVRKKTLKPTSVTVHSVKNNRAYLELLALIYSTSAVSGKHLRWFVITDTDAAKERLCKQIAKHNEARLNKKKELELQCKNTKQQPSNRRSERTDEPSPPTAPESPSTSTSIKTYSKRKRSPKPKR